MSIALLMTTALGGCGLVEADPPPPLKPMPRSVPKKPLYDSADDVVTKLRNEGIPCKVLRRAQFPPERGSGLTCAAAVAGTKFELEIDVSAPRSYDRKRIGTSLASRRKPPYSQTLVAAGNWYLRVLNPDQAPGVAKALGGVVLKPKGEPSPPKVVLPDIPGEPRYASAEEVASRLEKAAGCRDREVTHTGQIRCRTGTPGARDTNCAVVSLYSDAKQRDLALRNALAGRDSGVRFVAAGNWSVNLCDSSLATSVARSMDGVVVAPPSDGSPLATS